MFISVRLPSCCLFYFLIMKLLFVYLCCLFSVFCFAQSKDLSVTSSDITEVNVNDMVRYKIYPTKNMWTFIKLDTATGKTWQVQYSVEGDDYRFETSLSYISQISLFDSEVNGRFILVPTQNSYNFIMLDQFDGRTWQVQWSQNAENRGCLRIR